MRRPELLKVRLHEHELDALDRLVPSRGANRSEVVRNLVSDATLVEFDRIHSRRRARRSATNGGNPRAASLP